VSHRNRLSVATTAENRRDPIVAIEHDAIDAIITAAQKVLVNLAQPIGHEGDSTTHAIPDSSSQADTAIPATRWLNPS
jgi:hypothetical protein